MKNYIQIFFYFINFSFIFVSTHSLANICSEVLSNKNRSIILFYDDMIDRGGLNLNNLKQAREAIANGVELLNPFLGKMHGVSETVQLIRSQRFVSLSHVDQSVSDFSNWLDQKISDLEENDAIAKKSSGETRYINSRPIFNRIEAGSFTVLPDTIYENTIALNSELLQAFEMQSTPVTQGQWQALMGFNPSIHQNDNSLAFDGDRPVENITAWSAMEFANRFSIQDGYEPVYNLDNIQFEGSPETGDYNPIDEVVELVINAPDNDIYQAEGYRLPTVAEYYMVLTDRGRLHSAEVFRNHFETEVSEDLTGYFNFTESGLGATVESGSLKPVVSNGHEFFDLMGNVSIFTSNRFTGRDQIEGVNPVSVSLAFGILEGFATIGSTYKSNSDSLVKIGFRVERSTRHYKSETLGIRLVRTLK